MSNPYLASLPALQSLADRSASLGVIPHFNSAERSLPHVERRYALTRLFDYFAPSPRHLRVSEGIDMLIRKGYEGRDPSGGRHQQRAITIARRVKDKQLLLSNAQPAGGVSLTGALIGAPGMGKSRTIDLTLRQYDQVVRHSSMPTQITWLKLECPKRGSIRSLCAQFFTKLGGLVGNSDYVDLYGVGAASESDLQNMMALAASFHGLGLLVIDEIQNIGRSADGEHELMTFLTSLSNQLGIPLLVIGTLSVLGRVEETGRMARRSVGLASAVWHPLQRDSEWNTHLDALWRFQWTCAPSPITEELRLAFFECTGGILDLLVKLLVSVQLRLLYRSEIRGVPDEAITPAFVRSVAEVDFRPVKHIVKALVSGNEKLLRRFDDLHSFDVGFRAGLAQLVDAQVGSRITASAQIAKASVSARVPEGDQYEVIWSKLRADGLGDDVILRLIDKARADGADAQKDVLGFYEAVLKLKMKAKKLNRASRKLDLATLAPDDLRRLIPEAAERGLTPLEALLDAGLSGIWPVRQAA